MKCFHRKYIFLVLYYKRDQKACLVFEYFQFKDKNDIKKNKQNKKGRATLSKHYYKTKVFIFYAVIYFNQPKA